MIHLYCGPGKGKTTAAMGLALRMAGRGRGVVIAQFLKGADSGERIALARLPQVVLLPVPRQVPFTYQLSPQALEEEKARNLALLEQAGLAAQARECGLVVLDEVCPAVALGLLPLKRVLSLLDCIPAEVVLTDRDPHPALERRADYLTCFQKIRHPFDKGIDARAGVEF